MVKTIWQKAALSDARGPSFQQLADHFKLPDWIAKILWLRARQWDNADIDSYEVFFTPSLKYLPSPFLLPDMDKAVDRLVRALENDEKIAVFGDYDVDGTVGSALFRRFLRKLGCEPIMYQPNRHTEGYGMNEKAIRYLIDSGAQLIISIDCGIRDNHEVEVANQLGVDVLICDHHEVGDEMPKAYAVLDHKRADNHSPIRSLCGAGMAYYFAIATRAKLRELNWFVEKDIKEPDLRELLDLVAVATVADLVPLVVENRILVTNGLDRMRTKPCAGIEAILKTAGIDYQTVDSYHLGFVIGPRINAAGRLETAGIAMELLSTDDHEIALELAQKLEKLNSKRVQVQNKVTEEAMEQAEEQTEEQTDFAAIVTGSDDWHEGVIGIVASKLMDKFHRPVIVFSYNKETGVAKGSARCIDGLNLMNLFAECSDLITQYGGHAAAAGLSVPVANIDQLRERFSKAVAKQRTELFGEQEITKTIPVDAEVELQDITFRSLALLQKLGPFGMANKEPVIAVNGCAVKSSRLLKDKHLKLGLNHNLQAIWFNQSPEALVAEGELVDMLFMPKKNEFRGRVSIDLHIKDMKNTN